MYTEDKRREGERRADEERDSLQRRQAELDEAAVEDLGAFRVQAAQHDLARSAVKKLSVHQSRENEQIKHISAMYNQMNLASKQQQQAGSRTEREELETMIKGATKDMVRIECLSALYLLIINCGITKLLDFRDKIKQI